MNRDQIVETARLIEQAKKLTDQIDALTIKHNEIEWQIAKATGTAPQVTFVKAEKDIDSAQRIAPRPHGYSDDYSLFRDVLMDGRVVGWAFNAYDGFGCSTEYAELDCTDKIIRAGTEDELAEKIAREHYRQEHGA